MSNTMTHKRLVSAFSKIGCTVSNRLTWDGKPSQTWVAFNPKNCKQVEWYVQPAFVPAKDGKEACYDESNPVTTFVVMPSPDTDMQRDYNADLFLHTIKGAINAIS